MFYVGTMGKKLTVLDGLHRKFGDGVKKIAFRSNAICSMENVQELPNVVHIELYDNAIERIQGIESLSWLRILDLSFNNIRELPKELGNLNVLEELYVANNKIKCIENVAGLKSLRKLDLGANRIRLMQGLQTLTELKELWLGKNKITEIAGLESLVALEKLSIQVFVV